jgi:hypothetical protein
MRLTGAWRRVGLLISLIKVTGLGFLLCEDRDLPELLILDLDGVGVLEGSIN